MSFTYASSRSLKGSQVNLKRTSTTTTTSPSGGNTPLSSPALNASSPSSPNGSPPVEEGSPVVESGGTFANKDVILATLAARKKRREEVVLELGLQAVSAEEARSEGAHAVIDAHTQEVREGERRAALEAGYVSRLVTAVTDAHRSSDSAEAMKEREKEILSRRQRQKDVTGASPTSIPPNVATQIYIDDLGALLYGAQAPSQLVVSGGSNNGGSSLDQRDLAIPPSDIYAPKRVGMRQKNAFGVATEERWSLRPPGSLSVSAPVTLPSKHGGGGGGEGDGDGLTTSLREARILDTLSRTLGSALTHRQQHDDDWGSGAASSSSDIFSPHMMTRGDSCLRGGGTTTQSPTKAPTAPSNNINKPPHPLKIVPQYEHPVPKVVSSLIRASAPTSTATERTTTTNNQHQPTVNGHNNSVGGKSGPIANTRLVTLQELALSHRIHPSAAAASSSSSPGGATSGLPPKYSTLPNDVHGNVELDGLVIKRRIPLSDAMDAALLPDGVSMSSLQPDTAVLSSHASFAGREGLVTPDPTEQRIVFNKEFPHLEDVLAVKLMSDPPPSDMRNRRARRVQILSNQPVSEPLERDELCEGMLVIHHRRIDTRTGKPAPQMVTGSRLRLATANSSQPDPKDCTLQPPHEQQDNISSSTQQQLLDSGVVVTREQAVSNLLALDREHELLVTKALTEVRKDAHQYEMARQLQAAQDARRLRVCEPIEGVKTMFYFPTAEYTDPPYLQRLQTLQSVVRNLHSRFQFQPSVREYLCGHRVGAGCFPHVHRSFQSSIFSAQVRITPRQLRNNLRGLSGGVLSDSKIKRLLFTVCPVQEGVLLETLRNAREYRHREVEERIQSVVGREQSSLQPHLSVQRLTRALSSTANLQKMRHDRIANLKQNLAKINDKQQQPPPTIALPRAASLKRAPTVRFAPATKGSLNPAPQQQHTDPVEQLAAKIRDDAWISDVETDSVASSVGLDTMLDELTAFDVDEEFRPEPTKSLGERVAMLSTGLVTKVPVIPELGSERHVLSPHQMGADIGPLMAAAAQHSSNLIGGKRHSSRNARTARGAALSPTQRLNASGGSASPFSLMMSASWASSDDLNMDDDDDGESELEDGDDINIPKKQGATSPKRALNSALQAVRTILSFKSVLSDTNRKQSRNRMMDALDIKHNARRSRRPYPVGVWLNYSYPVEWVQGRLMTLLEAAVVTKVEDESGAPSHQLGPGSSNHSVLLDVYDLFLPMRLVEARAEHSMQVRKGLIPPSGATWIPPNITDSILAETATELRTLVLHERSTLAALEAPSSSLAYSEHSHHNNGGSRPTAFKKTKTPEEEAAEKKIEIRNQRQRVRFVQGRFKLLKLFSAEFHPFIMNMMGVATKAYLSATRTSRASRKRTPLPNGGHRTEYQPKDFAPIPVRPKISPAYLQRFLSFPRGFIEMSLGVVSGWGCNEVVASSPIPPRYGGIATSTHHDAIEPQPYSDFGGFAPTSEDKAVEEILRRLESVEGTGDGAQMAAELVAEAKDRISAYKHRQKVERLRIKIGPNGKTRKGGGDTAEVSAKREAMYQALSLRYNKLVGMVAVKSTVPSLDSCGPPNLLGVGGGKNVKRKGDHGGRGGEDGIDLYDLSIEEEEDREYESSGGGVLGLKESLSKAQHRLLEELTVKERSHLVDAVLSGVSIRSLPTLSQGEMETSEHRKNVEMIHRHNERVSLGRALVHHLKLAHLASSSVSGGGGGGSRVSIVAPSEPTTTSLSGGATTVGPTGGMLTDPRVPDHLRSSSLLIAGEPLYYECFGKLLQSSPPFAMALSGVLLYVIPPKV